MGTEMERGRSMPHPDAEVGLAGVDLLDPDGYVSGVPHELFARLRREAPVLRHPLPDGSAFWVLTRHRDVARVSRDWATFSSERRTALLNEPPEEGKRELRMMLLNMDPPRHGRLRSLVNRGFTSRMIERLTEPVRRLCATIVAAALDRGECDFVAQIAAPLPLQVIAEMLGIPEGDRRQIYEWSDQMLLGHDPEGRGTGEGPGRASAAMFAYANELARRRRLHPQDDLVSVLVQAEVDGERLTELEFDLFFLLLAVAGNETTRNAIAGGMLALLEHPEQWRRLQAVPSLVPRAVEEILRWVTPVMHFQRTATREVELGGHRISAGDRVAMYYVAANRDEAVFEEPGRFDVARWPNEHLAFGGGGPHFCLGAPLARLEIRLMLEELLRQVGEVEQVGPARRLRSNFINGLRELPVRLVPRAGRL